VSQTGGSPFVKAALAVVLAASIAGCAGQRGVREEKPVLLMTAGTNFLAGKYEQAEIDYTDFLATEHRPELTAEAYIGRGNVYYKLASYERAYNDYSAAFSMTKVKDLRGQAMSGMAASIFAQERYDTSEKLCRDLLRMYQGVIQQDEITLRLGLSQVRQSKWDEGAESLEQVIAKWPSGESAATAEAKLPPVKEKFFTVQTGAFTNKQVAEAALKDLKAKGFIGTLEPINIKGVAGYAVRSGHFSNWQATAEHADKLKSAGFSTYKLP
jgi:tetratricopeptide (TPR) repeat protein